MNHTELCYLTARRFAKDHFVTLVEYQSYSTNEFPDVLCFNGYTTLFEIKVSRKDFLKEAGKDCREKWKPKIGLYGRYIKESEKREIFLKAGAPELYYIEAPHLGVYRYYVCEPGLISPGDLPKGWGLYYIRGKRFFLQTRSGKFRRNIHQEISILTHAFRKYAEGERQQIIINGYKGLKE